MRNERSDGVKAKMLMYQLIADVSHLASDAQKNLEISVLLSGKVKPAGSRNGTEYQNSHSIFNYAW